MTVFFTADLHLGHARVAQLRWERFSRHAGFEYPSPQTMIEWHDEVLEQRWDSTVTKDDQVWVLGDLCLGEAQQLTDTLAWFTERPGEKYLVMGNHDKCHPKHRDGHKYLKQYREAFEEVLLAAQRKIILPDHTPVYAMLSHFPYLSDHKDTEPRFLEWRLRDEGRYLLHGHTHSAEQRVGREIHVGVDAWNLTPASLAQVTDLIAAEDLVTV